MSLSTFHFLLELFRFERKVAIKGKYKEESMFARKLSFIYTDQNINYQFRNQIRKSLPYLPLCAEGKLRLTLSRLCIVQSIHSILYFLQY